MGRADSAWRGGLGRGHRPLCPACLEPRLASSAGWQPVDQSRWAPPPILPTLTGNSSLPGES